MAVTFDTATTQQGSGGGGGTTHVVADQPNRLALLCVMIEGTGSVVNGATYNSVAMTLVSSKNGNGCRVEVYSLVAPATGSHAWAFTLDVGANWVASFQSFYNANQGDPVPTVVTASGNGAAPAISLASFAGRMNVDAIVVVDPVAATTTLTVGAGQTERWNLTQPGLGLAGIVGAGSTMPGTNGGADVMDWTINTDREYAHIALALRAATTAVSLSGSAVVVPAAGGASLRVQDGALIARVRQLESTVRALSSRR